MSMTLRIFMFASLAGLIGCKESTPPTSSFAVTFTTESDPGIPLPGVKVTIAGTPIGESSEDGLVQRVVEGPIGKRVPIEYECPQGHRHPGDKPALQLREFHAVGESESRGMQLKLRCPPSERRAAFVVRTKYGAGLPVFLDDQRIAETNAKGVAHFSDEGSPGTEYSVRIDTRSNRKLRPQNPTQHFTLPDRDEVFVVAQAFELPKKRIRKRRRRRIMKIE